MHQIGSLNQVYFGTPVHCVLCEQKLMGLFVILVKAYPAIYCFY